MEEFFNFCPCIPKSAFQRYTNYSHYPSNVVASSHHINSNKKVLEFLRRSWAETTAENDKSLKHKMVERMRRKQHNQLFLALHNELLHHETNKGDKNSILETAVMQIEELKQYSEELKKKNMEMEMGVERAEIKIKVDNPTCSVDSMLEILECLKNNGCTVTAIQSTFALHQLSAAIHFETKPGSQRTSAAEVIKRAIQKMFE